MYPRGYGEDVSMGSCVTPSVTDVRSSKDPGVPDAVPWAGGLCRGGSAANVKSGGAVRRNARFIGGHAGEADNAAHKLVRGGGFEQHFVKIDGAVHGAARRCGGIKKYRRRGIGMAYRLEQAPAVAPGQSLFRHHQPGRFAAERLERGGGIGGGHTLETVAVEQV